MFKKGWILRGTIYSDEGFSVGITDRTHLVYREGPKKMTVAGELLMNGFVFYLATIGPWDDATPIDENKKDQIADRIKRALASQGMAVDAE
ncbi:MAG TPA: Imm74 family immunity protein [Terriglobales bacterium]|jgi:hypothetical protein|nr:Imm74 family immunity protein [Terriglobales bacterium]